MTWLDDLSLSVIVMACLLLGFAPFFPEPHIWEKLKMLAAGTLKKPIDILDLLFHAEPFVVLIMKLFRMSG